MNTPETLPKNVQSFIAKHSPVSREQSAAFWKEFRKAANAYAKIQGERIDKLTTERNEARKQRDEANESLRLEIEFRNMYRKQRDELLAACAALMKVIGAPDSEESDCWAEVDEINAAWEMGGKAIANVKGEGGE